MLSFNEHMTYEDPKVFLNPKGLTIQILSPESFRDWQKITNDKSQKSNKIQIQNNNDRNLFMPKAFLMGEFW